MKRFLFLFALALTLLSSSAQKATLRINATTRHQHITGFGAFVCSPQFTYGHMSSDEINRVWGKTGTLRCNIMRVYLPIGRNAWSQSLATIKTAKQMGLIVFASPWGQPAEWKTNGTSNAKNSDGTTGKLKRENWADYAQYLDDYVTYLRNNGVELDAISIQNEPDWAASYAGCLWSASEIAEFVRTYGRQINCKIIAPETLAISDSYVSALNNQATLDAFDIYGGHLYGGLQQGCRQLAKKGKELWMTEYLINWNENQSTQRNFSWQLDIYNFFRSIHQCLMNDFNAWIHYTAKRYYGMLGDGTCGTGNGTLTKRGAVMAHFSRFITGMTRIETSWTDEGQTPLEGSAYLSQTGDSVVAVIMNTSDSERTLTLDLPFYSLKGETYTTTEQRNFQKGAFAATEETCRPTITIAPSSVVTAIFTKQRDLQPSLMTGSTQHLDPIENMKTTSSSFGTNYKLTGKTVTFDHSHPLISSNTTTSSGYLRLPSRYDRLVVGVKSVSSTMNLTSAKTTLYYVNSAGKAASHDYGELDLNRGTNFSIVLDLSPETLPDGCVGLIGLTNNNYSSVLTMKLGDVYLATGNHYGATLAGPYSPDDGYLAEYLADNGCTSIDLTGVSELPEGVAWQPRNPNCVFFMPEGSTTVTNGIVGDGCATLRLQGGEGNFRPGRVVSAQEATLTLPVDGLRMAVLPFAANVPAQTQVYTLALEGDHITATPLEGQTIEARQPVLIEAQGEVVFTGQGEVSAPLEVTDGIWHGTFTEKPLYTTDYVLTNENGTWGFTQTAGTAVMTAFGVYAQPQSSLSFLPLQGLSLGICDVARATAAPRQACNLLGQRVGQQHKGIIIKNGKKYMTQTPHAGS